METVYSSHKKTLQILSYKYPAKSHWVLKCPSHLPHLQILVKLFPKARFVWTHRSMDVVVMSFCALSSVFAVASLPALTPATMGQHILSYYKELVEKGIQGREALQDEDRFVDIQFTDVVNDPIQEVKNIYNKFGLELTTQFRDAMVHYLEVDAEKRSKLKNDNESNPRPKHTLEEFDLKLEELNEIFDSYHKQFLK